MRRQRDCHTERLHAEQTIERLPAGLTVCCQKPLGRTAAERGCVQ